MSKFALALAVIVLIASPLAGWADDAASLEQLVAEMAESPAQHASLADYYRHKAEGARDQAAIHVKMARSYEGGRFTARNKMKDHCRAIAKNNEAMAEQYEAMALLHEELATE